MLTQLHTTLAGEQLLQENECSEDTHNGRDTGTVTRHVSAGIRWRLFTSHFLSTWNSRVFEFGVCIPTINMTSGFSSDDADRKK